MSLTADEITIAVTVYNRREYLIESVRSALEQTVPVRVMVVEDCGPDPELESFVRRQFGNQVEYFRNPQRRGIFGNWNTCLEQCRTRWLSILHDDDSLKPDFVASILELNRQAGDRGLYYGQTIVVDVRGQEDAKWRKPALSAPWLPVTLEDVILSPPFSFPGQLFEVATAKALGGFRETSLFCGEWELWSKIIAHSGAAQTAKTVAVFRNHGAWDRGTSRIQRSGKADALVAVQRKRNLSLARRYGIQSERVKNRRDVRSPVSARFLLHNACFFSPYYLTYYARLVQRGAPQSWSNWLFREATRLGGVRFLKITSKIWRWFNRNQ